MVGLEVQKFKATISVQLAKMAAYKIDFLLVILAPAIVFLVVQVNLWEAIFEYNHLTSLRGYSLHEMIQYQALVLVVSILSQSQRSSNLSEDIRMGRLNAFLLYPFEFWQFQVGDFIAHLLIQVSIAVVALTILFATSVITEIQLSSILTGGSFCMGVAALWFVLQYAIGLAAFWLEETWIFRVSFGLSATFFSGAIFPLVFFPQGLQRVLEYSPFPLLTAIPIQLMLGTYQGSLIGVWVQLFTWIAAGIFLSAYLWRRGIKLYTAAGI